MSTGASVAEACEGWRASRVDVTESTRVLHRVALARVIPVLGNRRVDDLAGDDVAHLIETLSAAGSRRETIRKSVKYLAAVLDYEGVTPTRVGTSSGSGCRTKSTSS